MEDTVTTQVLYCTNMVKKDLSYKTFPKLYEVVCGNTKGPD